ncbi:MAG: endonuclease III [Planctomycetaceae bacterium]
MAKISQPGVAKKQRARKLVRGLAKTYGDVECALRHDSAFQLLVATILSAQCTDERVNATTPQLFDRFPTAADLANATQRQVEKIIHPLGFFRAKATNIRRMSAQLVAHHGGEVPDDLEALVQLAGVGRKTANVVLGTLFGIASGVVVDTHVKRISRLFGLTESGNPEVIERDLAAILPKKEWIMYSHRVIHHGRRICIARRPKCRECPLIKDCLRVDLPDLD